MNEFLHRDRNLAARDSDPQDPAADQALVEDPALKPRELIMLGRLVNRLAAHEAETAPRRSAGPSLSDLIAAAEQRRTITMREHTLSTTTMEQESRPGMADHPIGPNPVARFPPVPPVDPPTEPSPLEP